MGLAFQVVIQHEDFFGELASQKKVKNSRREGELLVVTKGEDFFDELASRKKVKKKQKRR